MNEPKENTFVEITFNEIHTTYSLPAKSALFFVKEVKKTEKQVRGYLLDYQVGVDPKAPYDFSEDHTSYKENMTRVWVDHTMTFEQFESCRETNKSKFRIPGIWNNWNGNELILFRLAGDRRVSYGDGGRADLVYPVWIAPKLRGVEEDRRSKLLLLLRKLSEERKDFHADSPVRDIIDPDLFPRMMEDANYVLNRVAEYKFRQTNNERIKREDLENLLRVMVPVEVPNGEDKWDYYDHPSPIIEAVEKGDQSRIQKLLLNKDGKRPHESLTLREQYQWIPSEFLIEANGKVKITTPINNIVDRIQYSEFYEEIEHIFSKMVPMFAKLNLINKNEQTKLQVIVKAQEYDLEPGMSYAGRWHMEGQTENIVAAGVYYLEVGQMTGGNLKFRPKHGPQDFYGIPTDNEVTNITTGTAIVFSNILPHRFRMMKNETEENQKRTFLNFFIVDPRRPVPLENVNYATADFLRLCLRRTVLESTSQYLPLEVINSILYYLPNIWDNIASAKKFRRQSRLAMLANKSGWGWIHWGNSGNTIFFGSQSTMSQADESECYSGLRNTESDE